MNHSLAINPKKKMSFASVKIDVNEKLYLRDPQQSKLGQKIIKEGILLIDEIGLERFTFKKLANRISSTEASIYRYFENKHFFLVYLLSWYWEWLKFRIDFNSMNIKDPKEKMEIIIKTIVDTVRLSIPANYIDRDALHRVVISEGTKAYHIKEIDDERKEGFFVTYTDLSKKIAKCILDIKPDFPYPKSLASNLLEMANNQVFFAQHLPGLTEIKIRKNKMDEVEKLLNYFIFGMLECK